MKTAYKVLTLALTLLVALSLATTFFPHISDARGIGGGGAGGMRGGGGMSRGGGGISRGGGAGIGSGGIGTGNRMPGNIGGNRQGNGIGQGGRNPGQNLRPGGSGNLRPGGGSGNLRPGGSGNLRPGGSGNLRPGGSGNLRPGNGNRPGIISDQAIALDPVISGQEACRAGTAVT